MSWLMPARRLFVASTALAGGLAAAASGLHAQAPADTVLFAVNNSTTLYTVNRGTGAATAFGTLLFGTTALARDPGTGRLYYLSTNTATPLGRVAYFDPATGTNTLLNATGNGDNIVRAAFTTPGVLYAVGTGGMLYTINTSTGAYTALGAITVGSAGGPTLPDNGDIATDADLTFYAVASSTANANNTSLYRVDLTTRIATEIGTVANTVLAALAFGANGVLYAGGSGGGFYSINKVTGAGTLVANTGFAYYDFATIARFSDLSITLSGTPLVVGQTGTYTLTASNLGPSLSNGPITVIDTLPAGLTYTSATGTGWTCTNAGQVVTCQSPGALAAGATLPAIAINATVGAGVAASVTDIARVSGSSIDYVQANNRATLALTVATVSVTPDGATVDRLPSNGTQYTQVFAVKNNGVASTSFTLATSLVPGGTVTVVSVNGVGGSSTTVTIGAGATLNVTVVYTVANAALAGVTDDLVLKATATASATNTDGGDLSVRVIRATLAMTKQLYRDDRTTLLTPSDKVKPGDYVQYKIAVTSTGVAAAATVHVTDALPPAMLYDSSAGDAAGWTITIAGSTVTADLAGTLPTGQSRFFWARVRVR